MSGKTAKKTGGAGDPLSPHPLREHIMDKAKPTDKTKSGHLICASQIARERGLTAGAVDYHVKALRDHGELEFVHSKLVKSKNLLTHYYRATARAGAEGEQHERSDERRTSR